MSRTIKIALYVVLVLAACVFAAKCRRAYTAAKTAQEHVFDDAPEAQDTATNASPVSATNLPGTNVVSATNQLSLTNTAAQTNAASSPTPLGKGSKPRTAQSPAPAKSSPTSGLSGIVLYGACFFLCVVGIGVLLSYDFSHFVAERFHKLILSDEGEGFKDPEYERAEQLWANNQFLEAIQLMREYLGKNPRKLYVALRIAEIYEKDLGNYLAAALEYEEVLKHPLLPEQWSWSAIHLANLYSGKLDQPDKAVAWLRRIVAEHGDTAAAAKARSRLEQLEGGTAAQAGEEATPEETPAPKPSSNLPKGFRPLTDR